MTNGNQVYLVDGKRTPQAPAGRELKDLPPWYLGSILIRHLLDNTSIADDQVDQVICGNMGAVVDFPNIARFMALAAGLHPQIPTITVQRNDLSGLEAISYGHTLITSKRSQVVLATGVESNSQMPLLYGPELANAVKNWRGTKNLTVVLEKLLTLKLSSIRPLATVQQEGQNSFGGLSLGMAGEWLAHHCGITRQEQDEWALLSHQRAFQWQQQSQAAGRLPAEMVPVLGGDLCQQLVYRDMAAPEPPTIEKLRALPPVFDPRGGTITTGNSSLQADGGACCLLASEQALQLYHLAPLARLVDFRYQGSSSPMSGMGPFLAIHQILKHANLALEQIDQWEISETFAAQLLSIRKALVDPQISQRWNLPALGEIPLEKLNVNGGSIAFGDPASATGNRLVVALAHELARKKLRWGIAALGMSGGQGGAILIENMANR